MTLTLIKGDGEAVDVLKPRLVKDSKTGQICMQIAIGRYEATLPLPDEAAAWTPERLQQFFENVVPQISQNLRDMAKKDRRKQRNKVKKA